jgi:6-phosphogluconolactonase
LVTATSAVIVAGLTGRAGPIVFSPLPVSERRRMTNNADANQVVAFQRDPNGTLDNPHSYGTDGRGSGGTVDPLTSQGSLTLSADHAWLFAVNAGSGSVSVFRVNGAQLELTDRVATEGSEPNSVAQLGSLVYVSGQPGPPAVGR